MDNAHLLLVDEQRPVGLYYVAQHNVNISCYYSDVFKLVLFPLHQAVQYVTAEVEPLYHTVVPGVLGTCHYSSKL